mmetsp:Transcript_4148/g.13614  ORF Transcript_4148/g.13614 Transcript_4148/m.13614 type:complete len:244 (+) Transcript_4148:78-809(+)
MSSKSVRDLTRQSSLFNGNRRVRNVNSAPRTRSVLNPKSRAKLRAIGREPIRWHGHAGRLRRAIRSAALKRQIVLVVRLGVVERLPRAANFRRNLAASLRRERLLVHLLARVHNGELFIRVAVNSTAILRPTIVTLAHALRRVVARPVHRQQIHQRHNLGIVHHLHALGVPRALRAHFFIRRIRRVSGDVTHGGGVHAWDAPKHLLRAPKAPRREHDRLHALRPRPLHGRAQHVVLFGHTHGL